MTAQNIPANGSALNQAAKQTLKEAGREADPKGLYCLQLVRWAVGQGGRDKINEHLLLFLELLEGWRPESVITFLEKNRNGEFLSLITGRNGNFQDLAQKIIGYMDTCMMEKVEGYPRKRRPAPPLTPMDHQKIAA